MCFLSGFDLTACQLDKVYSIPLVQRNAVIVRSYLHTLLSCFVEYFLILQTVLSHTSDLQTDVFSQIFENQTDTTNPSNSGPRRNVKEGVLYTPQNVRIEASTTDTV